MPVYVSLRLVAAVQHEVLEGLRGQPAAAPVVLEVGRALEPLFKGLGPTLFFLGLFAAAYSSFLVNSMIGGFMLADGLGLGDSPTDVWPRRFTLLVLLVGMAVGLYVINVMGGQRPVTLIVAAQAVTVLASPLVAGSPIAT